MGAATSGRAAEIAAGTYHCIAGGTRTMLTLGDVVITGDRYVLTDPTGGKTSGRVQSVGNGFRWGDFGALKADQIVDSGPESTAGSFYIKYKVTPDSLARSASCKKL